MTLFDVVAWLVHIAAVAWAWPWLSDKARVGRPLFWLSCMLPIISWCWLVPQGLNTRHRIEAEYRRQQRAARRRAAVPFLRQQLIDGTVLEQENARQVLEMWGAPEVEPPPGQSARADGGFALALDQVQRQIIDNLSIPPVMTGACPDCEVEEIPQRNAAGGLCVVHVVGRSCAAHGGVRLDVEIPFRPMR